MTFKCLTQGSYLLKSQLKLCTTCAVFLQTSNTTSCGSFIGRGWSHRHGYGRQCRHARGRRHRRGRRARAWGANRWRGPGAPAGACGLRQREHAEVGKRGQVRAGECGRSATEGGCAALGGIGRARTGRWSGAAGRWVGRRVGMHRGGGLGHRGGLSGMREHVAHGWLRAMNAVSTLARPHKHMYKHSHSRLTKQHSCLNNGHRPACHSSFAYVLIHLCFLLFHLVMAVKTCYICLYDSPIHHACCCCDPAMSRTVARLHNSSRRSN